MCLILFSIEQHPSYSLIVAANRDEFYARPTADADFWEDHPDILAGRDLQALGTWMGVTRTGKISMLTNYRDLSNLNPSAPSRGDLVSDFLKKNINEDQYLEMISSKGNEYNGFNLLFGNSKKLIYYSNISDEHKIITSGTYGLSNHLLDTEWPKVKKGRERLKEIIRQENIEPEQLFEALYDDIKAPDHHLPDTGVGLDLERMLSPMFIKSADYGSRCSTVVLVDKKDNWHFYERVYNTINYSYRTNEYIFRAKK